MYLLEFKNMCMQDCFRMPLTMLRLLILDVPAGAKLEDICCRIVSVDILIVMVTDMAVPAIKGNWIMQDFSRCQTRCHDILYTEHSV
jgi:hypothetical protein